MAELPAQGPFANVLFSGLVQGWLVTGHGDTIDTFRVRRAELKLSGDVTAKARWTIMIDPAKALSVNSRTAMIGETLVTTDTNISQASHILQDAFVTLSYVSHAQLDVGQFKLPLSLEGLQSSATLETVDRAMFASDRARGGFYGDVRDVGVRVYGPITSRIDYMVGVYNSTGQSQNDLDKDRRKAIAGRVTVRPQKIADLQMGMSAAWDKEPVTGTRRNRIGAELLYGRGPLTVKSEYMAGTDLALRRRGFYLLAGYQLSPLIQSVLRFDAWDPDTANDMTPQTVRERDYLAGVNVLLTGHKVKWQVNYVYQTFPHALENRHVVLSNLQVSW